MSTAREARSDIVLENGGPLQTLLRRWGLSSGGEHDLRRQTLAFVAVGWLPLLLCAGIDTLWVGRYPEFALDLSVHARVLVAVPLLLAHEHRVDRASRLSLQWFVTGGIALDIEEFARIVRGANWLRGARLPELGLLVVALVASQYIVWGGAVGVDDVGAPGAEHPTATVLWYSVVSLPMFQFFLGRAVWRWCIWCWVLWRLSRLRLMLIPTHPDLAGGLSFIDTASAALSLAAMAASSVLAATWAEKILAFREIRVATFITPFVSFVLIVQSVAVGPLLFFVGQCFRARRRGLREYGEFALRYTRAFHERWIEPGAGSVEPQGELLGSSDIQSLADLANSYAVVDRMRPLPVSPRLVALLVVSALLPMLPLIATERSLVDLVTMLGRNLLGGATGGLGR